MCSSDLFPSHDSKNVMIGVEEGFAHYNSLADRNHLAHFSAHIRRFKPLVDSVAYDIHAFEEQLVDLVFPFKANSVQFELAAPFFSSQGLNFSTWLEGFEPGFSEWNPDTYREY